MTTASAMLLLLIARVAVRFLPLSKLQLLLGPPVGPAAVGKATMPSDNESILAKRLAAHVERGANRLPGKSRCLPKAMALHWMLRWRAIPVRLVVAMHRQERTARHAFHAWSESGGVMLIGACERQDYVPLFVFEALPSDAPRSDLVVRRP